MKRRQQGVTLIELLVVIVIIAILAAIAIPSYRRYVIRANRADAKILLTQTAQALERCYTNSTPYAYNSAVCNAAVTLPATNAAGTYRVAFTAAPTATTYSLTATPLGAQAQDTQCGNFVLTQTGAQSVTGTLSATPANCWRR
jgi:type IV pilus assembly protein PilE